MIYINSKIIKFKPSEIKVINDGYCNLYFPAVV